VNTVNPCDPVDERAAAGVDALITEVWLHDVGFRWHQFERQPAKHWVLWLGASLSDYMVSHQDLGVEVAQAFDGTWFCWIRSDTAGRYHRFLHVRHLRLQDEVARLVEGLTGQRWTPAHHISGHVYTPERAARIRGERMRLDNVLLARNPFGAVEQDDSRGRALPEHLEDHARRNPADKQERSPG